MDSPRLGFRRAAVTSWALVGVGVAGVAGTSALAYSDTVKPVVADVGAEAAIPAPEELVPSPAENLPPAPEVVTTEDVPPPPPIPVGQPPDPTYTPTPEYTSEPTIEQSPPVTHQAPATQTQAPSTTKRRNLTPTTVRAPNYSPHVTISHGS